MATRNQEAPDEHEAGDREGPRRQAQRHARPGDHRGRRAARDIAQGRDAGQTFYSVLYSEAKKADGLVVQAGRGMFKLNRKRKRS
jgi:hypothetical protein